MKYVLSPVANEINGPIGGLTFVKHRKSPYARGNPLATRAPSGAQSDVRTAYGVLVSLWRSLDPELKAYWNSEADKLSISGFNFFVQVNSTIQIAGAPPYMLPPTLPNSSPESVLFSKVPRYTFFDIACLKPSWASDFGYAYILNPDSHTWESRVGGEWNNVTWKFPSSIWNSHCWEYYNMNSDTPTAGVGHWSNMSAVNPSFITQGVNSDGLEYNRYDDNQGYNTVPYSSAPGFFINTDWLLSFWVYFEEPASGDDNQYFMELDPALYVRRINFTSTIEFRLTGSASALNVRRPVVPDNTWTHIAVQNDSTNHIFYIWKNGQLDSAHNVTPYADRVSTRDYVFGGNPYRSSYKGIRLGNISYSAVMSRPAYIQYEALLRDADVRGRILYPNSSEDIQTGYVFGASGPLIGLGQDNFDTGRSLSP